MARIPVQKREGGGFPWWAWLLIGLVVLALILGLLWALLADDDEDAALAPVPTEPVAAVEPDPTEPVAAIEPVPTEPVAAVEPDPTEPAAAIESAATEVSAPEVVPTTPAAAAQTPAGAGGQITDLTTIFEEQDKPSLAGRRVDLRGETAAQVQSVTGDRTFWVGPSQDQVVLAVLNPEPQTPGDETEGAVDINSGQTLRITGEVRDMPSVDEAREQWGITQANADELQDQEIYIQVEQVEIIQR